MMRARVELLSRLLCDSGVIFVHLNRSTQDWYTQAATFACSSAAIFSTAAVIAGS
jgi:hypothetical protein